MDQVNDYEPAEEIADSREGYSVVAFALVASCALWLGVGLAIWRAFRP